MPRALVCYVLTDARGKKVNKVLLKVTYLTVSKSRNVGRCVWTAHARLPRAHTRELRYARAGRARGDGGGGGRGVLGRTSVTRQLARA